MSEPESWDDYNTRIRQERAQWQEQQDRISQPVHPKSDWDWGQQRSEPFVFTPRTDDSGGYGGGSYRSEPVDLAGCASTLVFVPSLVFWPVLYPVAAALGFVLAGLSYGIVEARFDVYREGPKLALGLVAGVIGFVAAIGLGRLEHRLAESGLYRWTRHLIRVALITFLAHTYAATELWPRTPATSPIPGLELLERPPYLGGLAAVAIVAHLVLTRETLRDWWHRRLEGVLLRPRLEPRAD